MNPITNARYRLLCLLFPLEGSPPSDIPITGRFAMFLDYKDPVSGMALKQPNEVKGFVVSTIPSGNGDRYEKPLSVTLLTPDGQLRAKKGESVEVISPSLELVEGVLRALESRPDVLERVRDDVAESSLGLEHMVRHLLHVTLARQKTPVERMGLEPLGPFACTYEKETPELKAREDGGCVHCGQQKDDEIHSEQRKLEVEASLAQRGA